MKFRSRPTLPLLAGLLLAASAGAQDGSHADHAAPADGPTPVLAGLGTWNHPIVTRNPQAQIYFDQGLRLVYAFNPEEAIRAFEKASELDPDAAMPYWGKALAIGPNINVPWLPGMMEKAAAAMAKARERARDPAEIAYIAALSRRYSTDPKADPQQLLKDYSDAMRAVHETYPEDPDATVLYAESLMTLRPWKLWKQDGSPAPETGEIINLLEGVLKRWPEHPGANHYYIHAVEASPNPGRALVSGERLARTMPGAGHVVHMPSHVQVRTGDWAGAIASNHAAQKVDDDYLKLRPDPGMFGMYIAHNHDFERYAQSMAGNYAGTRDATGRAMGFIGGALKSMPDMAPMFEPFLALEPQMALRFRDWDRALAWQPPEKAQPLTAAFYWYARAAALAGKGRVGSARVAAARFVEAAKAVPADAVYGNNSGAAILDLADAELRARIARAAGRRDEEIAAWTEAVAAQDALWYYEPPDWYWSVREGLGGALLRAGRFAEAESVFRRDLELTPGNGRSLFGLWKALEAEQKTEAARWVQREYEQAWRLADTPLTVDSL